MILKALMHYCYQTIILHTNLATQKKTLYRNIYLHLAVLFFVRKENKIYIYIFFSDKFDNAMKKGRFKVRNIYICKVTNCSPNPKELGYKPNKPNTINLLESG